MSFRPHKCLSHLLTRKYILVKPSSYPPWDLIVAFHGWGGSPRGMRRRTELDKVAEATGSAILYIKAPNRNWGGWLKWSSNQKHLVYVDGIIKSVMNKLDPNCSGRLNNFWFVGHSDGGSLAVWYRAQRFPFYSGGVVCYAGLLWERIETGTRKYPLLVIQGIRDRLLKREYVKQVIDFHKELGHPVEFERAPNGHMWHSEINPKIVDFIERYRK